MAFPWKKVLVLGFEYLIVLHILKTTSYTQNHQSHPCFADMRKTFCRSRAAFDLAEIWLDLAQREMAAAQFFRSEWFIFCPLQLAVVTWPHFDHFQGHFHYFPQLILVDLKNSTRTSTKYIFVTSIYICLGWESRPKGVHVLLAVTRWVITTTICWCCQNINLFCFYQNSRRVLLIGQG